MSACGCGPRGAGAREGEVNQVAEKKITPKKATKSTAKRASTEAATRVTKRKQKRMRKAAK